MALMQSNLFVSNFVTESIVAYMFLEEEHFPDVTEALQLLPRCHLSLHHNDKESCYRGWCCRASTSDVARNHLHHPQSFSQVPINKQQLGELQGECLWWGSNPRQQSITLPLEQPVHNLEPGICSLIWKNCLYTCNMLLICLILHLTL